MKMYGDDYDYANGRLAGTIVTTVEGSPIWVDSIDPNGKAVVRMLDTFEQKVIRAEAIAPSCIRLGYVNFDHTCTYLSRIPRRNDWRQGLRSNTARFFPFVVRLDDVLKEVSSTIKGEYPKFKAAVLTTKKLGAAARMAWCRTWCVDGDGGLYYKGGANTVGSLRPGHYDILETHLVESFLESLDEDGKKYLGVA